MDLICHDLGRRPYGPTLKLQQRLVERVQAAPTGPGFLLLVEHDPPVITTGRRPCGEQILLPPAELARRGIEFFQTSRGGTVTYHGPGQLVAYPILRLASICRGVRDYVHGLEDALIRLLGRFGLAGERAEGITGVWLAGQKIAAIGVAVSRWVAWHGLALNVSTNLDHFGCIVPCGLAGKGVTSMSQALGRPVSVEEVKPVLVECLCEEFGVSLRLSRSPRSQRTQRSQRKKREITKKQESEGKREEHACGFAERCFGAKHGSGAEGGSAIDSSQSTARRFPPWLHKSLPTGPAASSVRRMLGELKLSTVCSSALCPNQGECFSRRTATFLILGDRCTRSCRFCAVGNLRTVAHEPSVHPQGMKSWHPQACCSLGGVAFPRHPAPTADTPKQTTLGGATNCAVFGAETGLPPPRGDEPEAVAEACARLGLRHVVITSVTRDDLPDGGAGHFARTIRAVRHRLGGAVIEVLTPDFQGRQEDLDTVLEARPDVFNHNVETVPRLHPLIRPQADYHRSLGVLEYVARRGSWGTVGDPQGTRSQSAGLCEERTRSQSVEFCEEASRAASATLRSQRSLPSLRSTSRRPSRESCRSLEAPRVVTKSGLMVGLGETHDEVLQVLRDLRAAGCEILTIGQYLAPSQDHAPVQRFVEPAEFAELESAAREMGFAAVAAGPFVRSSYLAEQVFSPFAVHP